MSRGGSKGSQSGRSKRPSPQPQEKLQKSRKQRKAERDPNEPPKPIRTVENSRKPSETAVQTDDPEIHMADSIDEFAQFFSGQETPKVLITSTRRARPATVDFCDELADVFPGAQFVRRPPTHLVKDVVAEAIPRGFTHLIIVAEDLRLPHSMTITKLPEGPTAYFRVTSVRHGKELAGHGRSSSHTPELILNNFSSRLAHTIGRMFVSLFPPVPQFHGRQVVTFHNQRDFIFVRRHRYIFDDQGRRVTLQEIGPRFTLRLEALQRGIYDRRSGEFELSHEAANRASRAKDFLL